MNNDHLIHAIEKDNHLPTIFFFCCTHGNEKAGYKALNQLFEHLRNLEHYLNANVYAILGNLKAFSEEERYIDKDLNRIWTTENIKNADLYSAENHEYSELSSVYQLIAEKVKNKKGEVYFIDLHTTSSKSKPFIVMNDSLKNIKFASRLGISVIIGVERFVKGSMLDFFNERGYVSFAFEGGRHDDKDAVYAIEDFCIKILLQTQALAQSDAELVDKNVRLKPSKFYEMVYRHQINYKDHFQMINGFKNFQPIYKGEQIARHNNCTIESPDNFTMFMPLYQDKGEDGFFFIKSIPGYKLKLFSFLRKSKIQNLLLSSYKIKHEDKNTLVVSSKQINRFQKYILRLLGFRKQKSLNQNKSIFKRNERFPQPVENWLH